jgi:hypothetical protein
MYYTGFKVYCNIDRHFKPEEELMRTLQGLVLICSAVLLIVGCSDSPNITNPSADGTTITLTERPTFIETRPQATIDLFVLQGNPAAVFDKRPPQPPDTGGDPNPNPAHKYAYIVGISDYEGTANDLQYCDDDAMDMKAYFQSQGFTIRMDLDRNATADAITAGLQWLASMAVAGDEVAFAYSGHGAKASGYGSSIISTDLYYVTHGYVAQYWNTINCTKRLFTLDCCVAGDFMPDAYTGEVRALASTTTNSYDAPDLGNGAWTYYFLEGAEDLNMKYAEDCATHAETGMKAWAALYHVRVSPKHVDLYTGMFDM